MSKFRSSLERDRILRRETMVLWSRRFLKSHAVKGSISAPKVNCHHHQRPTKHTHATNIYGDVVEFILNATFGGTG
jgi:hypothetical protein